MNGISTTSTSSRRQHYNQNSHYNSPSFSSSLLEEIYRSFDEDEGENEYHHHHQHHHNHQTNDGYRKVKNNKSGIEREIESERLRGVNRLVLQQWMENDRINRRRNSMAAINSTSAKFNSSSSTSSSDSSSGIGGFSSSDTESLYGSSKSKLVPTLKPIKTNLNQPEFHRKSYSDEIPAKMKGGNKEGNLQKRALKLYGDLKKVKQPISPGGKLASFLNSLFNSNSSKKPKISSSSSLSSSSNVMKYSTSTPSTASSYSRSCLSKTPSSAGRFERRSVRFCPVSTVIAATNDDKEYNEGKRDDRWREKGTTRNSSTLKNDEFKVQISEKQRRVEEVAKELLKKYHHGRKYQNDGSDNKTKNCDFDDEDEDEDEEDDDASCCSSDLFELDHLLEVGSEHHRRYREELPVYETTHVHTNRAIANGLIL